MKLLFKKFLFDNAGISAGELDEPADSLVISLMGTPNKYSIEDIHNTDIWRSLGVDEIKISQYGDRYSIVFMANINAIKNFSFETYNDIEFSSKEEYNLWLGLQ